MYYGTLHVSKPMLPRQKHSILLGYWCISFSVASLCSWSLSTERETKWLALQYGARFGTAPFSFFEAACSVDAIAFALHDTLVALFPKRHVLLVGIVFREAELHSLS